MEGRGIHVGVAARNSKSNCPDSLGTNCQRPCALLTSYCHIPGENVCSFARGNFRAQRRVRGGGRRDVTSQK